MRERRGFTLIEMAVVLFIATVVLGAIAQYVTAQVLQARLSSTRAKQDAIKTALVGFISRNNRLPCPAAATIAMGGANNGVEVAAGTCAGAGVTVNGAVASGVLPWVTLGLPNDTALDGYGNRFTYQVVVAATALTAQTIAGMRGAINVHTTTPVAAGNQTNDCSAGATTNPCAAVAVVVSHGLDGYGAYNEQGVQIAVPAGIVNGDAWENTNGDNAVVVKAFSGSANNPYDDIVMVLTPGELLAPLTNSGALQDSRAALNANFNSIKNAIMLRLINAPSTAGPPLWIYDLPANSNVSAIPALGLPVTVTNDPWGNPIRFTQVTSPINSPGTAPSAIAFTLTSDGPDGPTGTAADNIALDVLVGEFQTLAAKFR